MAWALGETGNVTEAITYAEKAHKLKPNLAQIMDTYGYLLLLSGNVEQARDMLALAHNKLQEEPTIAYHYAMALKRHGNINLALEEVEQALMMTNLSDRDAALKLQESLR